MEFVTAKRTRSRKRKRHVRKRRREQVKFDVRSGKRQRLISERGDVVIGKEKIVSNTMQANAFWENYSTALEWQKRHSIVWWKSRCHALERENQILRDKIRCLAGQDNVSNSWVPVNKHQVNAETNSEDEEAGDCSADEGLEFQVDEDMMTFLEQSIKHKHELKKRREEENASEDTKGEEATFESVAEMTRTRNVGAKLLYGDASPRILAMETALEATMDRHKTRAKPRYWPNIPFKP